jgi:hypothetical protein
MKYTAYSDNLPETTKLDNIEYILGKDYREWAEKNASQNCIDHLADERTAVSYAKKFVKLVYQMKFGANGRP